MPRLIRLLLLLLCAPVLLVALPLLLVLVRLDERDRGKVRGLGARR